MSNMGLEGAQFFRLGTRPDPTAVVMFVAEHRDLGVERIRRVFDVASSTFYGWLAQTEPSEHDEMDRALLSEIADIRAGDEDTLGCRSRHGAG